MNPLDTPPPPTGQPTQTEPKTKAKPSRWAVVLAVGAGIFLFLPSLEGFISNPDTFVPLIFIRFVLAGAVAFGVWAVVRPRRPNVFLVTFAIVAVLLGFAVFAVN